MSGTEMTARGFTSAKASKMIFGDGMRVRKCETVAWFRHKIEQVLTAHQLPGEDIVADIASDYFEDYAHYIDRAFDMQNEEYINYIKQLQLI